ncbi:ZCHC3 protein, partial [Atractosteus spatula]|nr:ZCHC3 protein [Atractosteus spatula]
MHNPFVLETDIYAFLCWYVEILKDGWRVRDGVRVWTGHWQYRVRFRPDSASKDGFRHPPANFFLGSNQGYLFYAGQPKLCRRCGGEGHLLANCIKVICRRCGKEGHEVRDCKERPRCSLCNEVGHLFKNCFERQPERVIALRTGLAELQEDEGTSEEEEEGVQEGGDMELGGTEEEVRKVGGAGRGKKKKKVRGRAREEGDGSRKGEEGDIVGKDRDKGAGLPVEGGREE